MHEPSIEEQWRRKLLDEGFENIYLWHDGPNAEYRDHSHVFTSAHIVLEGEMKVISEHTGRILKRGDRIDVIAGTVHSVKMGSEGCRYIVAEKHGN
ncbi:MAG: cupin domain-containing protein [bacterium]|nr:cupin domain-containing protein [bacterium]